MVAQIVWGGVTVLTDLNPAVVIGHFLISMVLVWSATVLHARRIARRRRRPDAKAGRRSSAVTAATWAAGGALLAVLVTGPIATGTGPHAGDANAPRFGFNISSVVRVHSATAWLLVGAVVWLAFEAARSKDGPTIFRTQVIVLLTLAQGAVGYTQYAGSAAGVGGRPHRRGHPPGRGDHPNGTLNPRPRLSRPGGDMTTSAPDTLERAEVDESFDLDRPWVVIVWNDPVNLMEYVTFVFQSLFGFSKEKATKLMLDVHPTSAGPQWPPAPGSAASSMFCACTNMGCGRRWNTTSDYAGRPARHR
nr:ATP-dependent Clp protease adaptor ClpS [Candidatus Microthrix sp.]